MPAPAHTGGDTALPMRDVIRMGADGIHYLAVFDDHNERPLYLGRQNRIATTDQRIICYARDGGCTRPNCPEPGYHDEVHHSPDWATGGATDADTLFFACARPRPDHQRPLPNHHHRHRPPGLDRRHTTTRNHPRPPPRRTPPRQHRPTQHPTRLRRSALTTSAPNASAPGREPTAAG
jgi:hypothetical protein